DGRADPPEAHRRHSDEDECGDPAGRRGGDEPQVEDRHQTVTRSRIFPRTDGPIPETSPSWSTDENPPLSVRHCTIRSARAGPIPGRVSSSSSDAALTSTSPGAAGAPLPPPPVPVAAPGGLSTVSPGAGT